MATLVNKKNREVKVIIPNMREFRTFYSDNEGVIGMFFKRDWEEEIAKKEEHWKPSEEQMKALLVTIGDEKERGSDVVKPLRSLYYDLKKL
jgi:ribosomal protein S1